MNKPTRCLDVKGIHNEKKRNCFFYDQVYYLARVGLEWVLSSVQILGIVVTFSNHLPTL